ncbi:RNA polymerase sigma factor SigJ [Actinomadura sp. NAK00032]|uniref:RNA polymerase sigma factor SigJ n=1 Tax=Actinomadura sp. NAK00032 TaxID=2742128 RepID=UPI001590157D|nr:RNA polymerase sigma factor SigJ [Actinomadura sp. NAK00032]QKW36312.1 RNA polymerase sigma factor SigJ [Actinomadura sp. NAK00032]
MSTSDPYVDLRSRAFAIAYQMLGSVGEAEDVMQEAFLRLHRTQRDGETIASPRAYIATLVTRLAIDQWRSARARREQYVGEWLPEPLAADPSPGEHAETADSLSLAVLVLLETLTPQQRAAFLLREVFDYPYTEVAEIIGTDVDTTRHLVARARRRVRERRPRYHATRQQQRRLAGRFFAAVEHGDLPALEELLAQDVAMHGDGGGRVPALGRPLNGRQPVARVLAAMAPLLARAGGVRFDLTKVNGQPGALVFDTRGLLVAVMALDITDGHIQTIHSIVNPDKLQHFGRVGNLGDLVRADPDPTGDA